MKILVFSDVPNGFTFPDSNPDMVFLLGDISYRNILRINHKYHCTKVGVLGNHDKEHYFDDTEIINIHRTVQEIKGVTFAGFQGSPKYSNKPFGQHLEIEAEAFVAGIYNKKIDVFLSHSNPVYEHTDQDSHRGFKAFNDLYHYDTVKYFFHGHLHEPFKLEKNNTIIHSVYPYLELELDF